MIVRQAPTRRLVARRRVPYVRLVNTRRWERLAAMIAQRARLHLMEFHVWRVPMAAGLLSVLVFVRNVKEANTLRMGCHVINALRAAALVLARQPVWLVQMVLIRLLDRLVVLRAHKVSTLLTGLLVINALVARLRQVRVRRFATAVWLEHTRLMECNAMLVQQARGRQMEPDRVAVVRLVSGLQLVRHLVKHVLVAITLLTGCRVTCALLDRFLVLAREVVHCARAVHTPLTVWCVIHARLVLLQAAAVHHHVPLVLMVLLRQRLVHLPVFHVWQGSIRLMDFLVIDARMERIRQVERLLVKLARVVRLLLTAFRVIRAYQVRLRRRQAQVLVHHVQMVRFLELELPLALFAAPVTILWTR